MKLKNLIWILVLLTILPGVFAATCYEGTCCEAPLVLPAQTLVTTYECDSHTGDLVERVVSCNGLSPDSITTTTTYLDCNETQYCDADAIACVEGAESFPDPWGYEHIEGENMNLFKASVEPWKQGGVNGIALYFSWGFLPLLLGVMAGIRFRKVLPTAFLILLSTVFLIAFDLLPGTVGGTTIYFGIVLTITITIAGFVGNR